jgi:hypothetical protein
MLRGADSHAADKKGHLKYVMEAKQTEARWPDPYWQIMDKALQLVGQSNIAAAFSELRHLSLGDTLEQRACRPFIEYIGRG